MRAPARPSLVVAFATAGLLTVAGCAPAGRHANPFTLPYEQRMPYGPRQVCGSLLAQSAHNVRVNLVPIGKTVTAESSVGTPKGDWSILVRQAPRATRFYGVILPCRPERAGARVVIRFGLRSAATSVQHVAVVLQATGGRTVPGEVARLRLRVGRRWQSITIAGVVPGDRDTIGLIVEARPGSPRRAFLLSRPRVSG